MAKKHENSPPLMQKVYSEVRWNSYDSTQNSRDGVSSTGGEG